MNTPFLIGDKIYLRPISLEDSVLLSQGENDPLIRETLFLAFPLAVSQAEEKIRQYINSREAIVLVIVEKDSDRSIGQTAFFRLDYVSRAAVFYLAILDPSFWSRGYGTEATQLMIDYAFATLNLNRIQLHVCAENTSAIKIYQRVGFIKEGELRQAMFRNSHYADFWVMGMLRSDWLARKAEERRTE
jgi:RimJ/RimL family protein N-acetyltransferase